MEIRAGGDHGSRNNQIPKKAASEKQLKEQYGYEERPRWYQFELQKPTLALASSTRNHHWWSTARK